MISIFVLSCGVVVGMNARLAFIISNIDPFKGNFADEPTDRADFFVP